VSMMRVLGGHRIACVELTEPFDQRIRDNQKISMTHTWLFGAVKFFP
jgi:hypothetical protein